MTGNLSVMLGHGDGRARLVEAPDPLAPTGSEIRIRMLYAPVNPADLLAISGSYAFTLAGDAPIGAEGVGEVEAVGDAVRDLRPGDRVLPLDRGNWCRWRTVARTDVVPVPAGIDPVQAAMLRINPATAALLLDAAGVRPEECLVQNAAGSVVASWVRAFAAARRMHLINVLRHPDPHLPQALVDGEDIAARISEAAQGLPVRAALDCVAGEGSGRLARCLAPDGRLIVFGHLSGTPVTVPSRLLTGGALSICGFSLRPAEARLDAAKRSAMFDDIFRLHGAGGLDVPVRAVLPLADANAAIDLAQAGGKGRVLLDLRA